MIDILILIFAGFGWVAVGFMGVQLLGYSITKQWFNGDGEYRLHTLLFELMLAVFGPAVFILMAFSHSLDVAERFFSGRFKTLSKIMNYNIKGRKNEK